MNRCRGRRPAGQNLDKPSIVDVRRCLNTWKQSNPKAIGCGVTGGNVVVYEQTSRPLDIDFFTIIF